MNKIIELTQLCTPCLTEYRGKTSDNKEVYVRYWQGNLYIEIGDERVFERKLDKKGEDGYLPYDELTTFARNLVDWPEELSDNLTKE